MPHLRQTHRDKTRPQEGRKQLPMLIERTSSIAQQMDNFGQRLNIGQAAVAMWLYNAEDRMSNAVRAAQGAHALCFATSPAGRAQAGGGSWACGYPGERRQWRISRERS